MIAFQKTAVLEKEALIVFISEEQLKANASCLKNAWLKTALQELKKTKQFSAKDGEIFPQMIAKRIVLFVGTGKQADLSMTRLRILTKKALTSSYLKSKKNVEILPFSLDTAVIKAIIEGVLIGGYSWKKYVSRSKDDTTVENKKVYVIADKKKEYLEAVKICEGVNFARNLVNDNADTVTSTLLEREVKKLIKGQKGVKLEILNKKQLQAKGLGLHLAVNQGSNKEPKLIIVKYTGAPKSRKWLALVGKGITYDTGGLNLKPSGHMECMRMDMGGTACVLGTLKNILSLKVKKNVIFACGVAENAIGPGAYKPGDIIKGYAGKTVEIANTDAEGRLVLADAIAYVKKNYKPTHMVDIATLTGACIVALGHDYTGLVSTDETFAKDLLASANETDDRAWRLPSYPELKTSVKSKIADIRNLGSPRGAGGTITAAEFLRQFAEDGKDKPKWAHLDIAGTAFIEEDSRMYFSYGATGSGVRLLTNYIQNN